MNTCRRAYFNVITDQNDLGALLTKHPDVAKVSFTGSTATGKKVMESAAGSLKRVTLELGGNDAAIVLDDVDPKSSRRSCSRRHVEFGSGMSRDQAYLCARVSYDPCAASLPNSPMRPLVGNGMHRCYSIRTAAEQNPVRESRRADGANSRDGQFIAGAALAMDRAFIRRRSCGHLRTARDSFERNSSAP